MPHSSLCRRYDGPIPDWEQDRATLTTRQSLCLFHKGRALDAARQCLDQLRSASAYGGALRNLYWQKALVSLVRYQEGRTAHSRLIKRVKGIMPLRVRAAPAMGTRAPSVSD